jgi:natural product precursor
MKKISLQKLSSVLSDKELKNVLGGSGSGSHTCKVSITCLSGANIECSGTNVDCSYYKDKSGDPGWVQCGKNRTWCTTSS